MNDFSAALNNFQVVQRRAAERERESMAKARAGSRFLVWKNTQTMLCILAESFIFLNVYTYVKYKLST